MECHQPSNLKTQEYYQEGGSIALIGHPNVGKSAIFQRLTGQRVIVSNYPGTTVEVVRGNLRQVSNNDNPIKNQIRNEVVMVDTPGVMAFPSYSDDELVTEKVLFDEPLTSVLQVGDAKNLRRTLMLTAQLAEMGLPLVLALNMMDEARSRGICIDCQSIQEQMGLTVVPTIAVQGNGIDELIVALENPSAAQFHLEYSPEIEGEIQHVIECIHEAGVTPPEITMRSLALLWLSGDRLSAEWMCLNFSVAEFQLLVKRRESLEQSFGVPLATRILQTRLDHIEMIVDEVIQESDQQDTRISERLERLTTHPLWGWMILALVLYGLYWFVGVFGAGVLVGFFEEYLFGEIINPWIVVWVERLIPVPFVVDLLVGEFGLWTMGITYALALILPIVTTFFFAFGLMEDSGYLPRVAALSNRVFQTLGLNGKAVLPMVLGLGCVTMATMTTRILSSRRERLLVILLLALAVPCSAQLGVVMGLLAGISLGATMIWAGVVLLIFLVVGWLAAYLMPGERTMLLVELPPMRLPLFSNVVMKTLARLEWYLKEVVPLFLIGAFIMFLLDVSGVLAWLIKIGEPLVVSWLGLPAEASAAFIMGFLRRDFGATGLFMMESQGLLSPAQVVVAMVTVTLFIPCIASVMMIAKERSWRTAMGMTLLVMPLAFIVGGLLYRLLLTVGWGV